MIKIAAPTTLEVLESEDNRLFNGLIDSNDLDGAPMLDFETDYELGKFTELQPYDFLPDQVRDKIVNQLRMTAIQIKLKIDDLIVKMDNEIIKLEDAYKATGNAYYKSKFWTQIHSLKMLRSLTQMGLDKFNHYVISEESKVLENLIRTLEKLFEAKFFKFSVLAKASLKLIEAVKS